MYQEIENALKAIQSGGTIVYPTDTVWGIGCDATNEQAVGNIFQIKQREESKSLIILVDGLEMLVKHVQTLPKNIIDFLEEQSRPTTIIYPNAKNLAKNVVANDGSVAIRIVQNDFCKQLIAALGKPLVSTSANTSGNGTPMCFDNIEKSILDSVDYVVDLHRDKTSKSASQLVRFDEVGKIEYLRK